MVASQGGHTFIDDAILLHREYFHHLHWPEANITGRHWGKFIVCNIYSYVEKIKKSWSINKKKSYKKTHLSRPQIHSRGSKNHVGQGKSHAGQSHLRQV